MVEICRHNALSTEPCSRLVNSFYYKFAISDNMSQFYDIMFTILNIRTMTNIIYTILLIFITKLQKTNSSISVLDKGLIPLEPGSIAIQFFVTVENFDSASACDVHIWPKRCCHLDPGRESCRTLTVYGVNRKTIEPKDLETLIVVYPAIYKYNHMGYCNLVLVSDCPEKKIKRETIRLTFNTSVTDKSFFIKKCDTADQDPYNDCSPIHCDEKYLGYRPFYSSSGKCAVAPVCERDFSKELPDIVYVPDSNSCRDLDNPLSISDIYSFSTGYGVVTESEKSEPIAIELKSNLSTISQNLLFLKDLMYGKLCPLGNHISINYSKSCKSAIWAISACILALVALLLSSVCCIVTTIWICKKWSSGDLGQCLSRFKEKVFGNRFRCEEKYSKVNKNVKNKLLRDVIVTDLPLELRESAINLCERIGKEVRWKKLYRAETVAKVLKNESSSSSNSST